MGCQSEVQIGENLTFSITTHDPDTGVLTDADDAPTYRVYEDETAAPILTGTMAILDDVNTTGFYTELIACTLVNGFEPERSYTIYIEATVDGDTGGICYGFRVISQFGLGAVEVTYTLTSDVFPNPPIADADVWVTTDVGGTNVVASGRTDALGQVTFWLDPGQVYIWRQKSGWSFVNPDVETVP